MYDELEYLTQNVFKQQTLSICGKFRELAFIFTGKQNNNSLNREIIKQTDALLFKFTLAVINLEFLWRISENKKSIISNNEVEKYEWNNSKSIIDALFLENTIIQIRAFIDFAQQLSCTTLGNTEKVKKTSKFYKILDKINSEKSSNIKKEFEIVDNSWGKLIRSLRNKVVHYDIINTKHEFRPQIQSKSYEEFAQEMTNNMFSMLVKLSEILFEEKWVPGTLQELKNKYNS